MGYSEDGTLNGYMNFTLSYFATKDFKTSNSSFAINGTVNEVPEFCRLLARQLCR